MVHVKGFWRSFLMGLACPLILLGVLAFWLVRDGFSARASPSRLEGALAHFALRASVPQRERSQVNPVQASAAVLVEAEEHFADHCAVCHANNGSGHTMYGDGLNPAPPDMRSAATQSKSDGELYSIIQNGIRMSGMPAFGAPGNKDVSTWKLVLFLRHLPTLTPEEELAMRKMNPITPREREEEQEEEDFLHGTEPKPKGNFQ